jgi:hypothetical protein
VSASSTRTIIIEPLPSGEFDHERAADVLSDLLGTLKILGGKVEVLADRIKVGELPPEREGKFAEPLGETVGLVISYRTLPALNEKSITRQAMDVALGGAPVAEEKPGEPEPAEPDDAGAEEWADDLDGERTGEPVA